MIPSESSDFGSCEMIIHKKKAQPPEQAHGRIARTYLHMDQVYSKYSMSKQQRKLMVSWDNQYPITDIEYARTAEIFKLQGNINPVANKRCSDS